MGNCFTCLKEPEQTSALENNTTHAYKEEMPEAHLYSAPSHVIPTSSTTTAASSPVETSLIVSNGNHLALVTSTTAPLQEQQASLPNEILTSNIKFYTSYGRRYLGNTLTTASVATTKMGLSDSKQQQQTLLHQQHHPALPSDTKLNVLFDVYMDKDDECISVGGNNNQQDEDDVILAEGIEQLCRDLQVSPQDFKVLVFAWQLNAEQMCRFTRKEFVAGMKSMRVDSIRGIQNYLPELIKRLRSERDLFKELYKFTFRFGLESGPSCRSLTIDMAISLWRLVFTLNEPPILDRWLQFLDKNRDVVKSIPRDTWSMFLNFSETITDDIDMDLSRYDDNEAWPCLFDDFVEYERDRMNQNVVVVDGSRKWDL